MSDEKLSPFDIVSILNEKKRELDEDQIKESYGAWIINHALSNMRDTVLYSNEMNRLHGLDKDMQYAFYYHGIPKRRRYGKWNKVAEDKDSIDLVMEYYPHLSKKRIKEVLSILAPKMGEIKEALYKGGSRKKK